jgi:hypothetical protein
LGGGRGYLTGLNRSLTDNNLAQVVNLVLIKVLELDSIPVKKVGTDNKKNAYSPLII